MAQIIILSDTIYYGEIGSSRYMGPYVIASELERAGLDTIVIDYFTKKSNFFEYLSQFLNEETLLVGLSTTFLMPELSYFGQARNRHESFELARDSFLWFHDKNEWIDWSARLRDLLRRLAPNAKIIIGGTKAPDFLQDPSTGEFVDYIVLAAGDRSLVDCATKLQQGKDPDFTSKNGVKVLSDISLKHLVDVIPETFYQKKWAIQPREALPFEISRGCIFNCKFCSYEKKNSIRKTHDKIKEELTRNYEMFGTTVYNFCDDCFNDSRKKVETVCNAILQLPFKIEWVSFARPDVSVKFPETLDLMVAAGASSLIWGIESFNAQVARAAGKGTHPDEVKEFLLQAKKKYNQQCFMYASFIVGLPGESVESVKKTIEWVLENDALHNVSFGALELYQYNESLDKLAIDFADYTREPSRYGFRNVNSNSSYWENGHMNSIEAKELANFANRSWLESKGAGLFSYSWHYTHFRTLGYSKEDLFSRFLDNSLKFDLAQEVIIKNELFLKNYFNELMQIEALT